MDSLISGIIDCVARPSTTDSPVRIIRKSASDSPNCVSLGPSNMVLTAESTHSACCGDSDSEMSTTNHNLIPPPPSSHLMRGFSSSSSLSRLMVPAGAEMPLSISSTPINSVLTAEGIIMGDDCRGGFGATVCGTCGDCTNCYADVGDDGCTMNSSDSIDNSVIRQFEAAFATFLYKNPAFTSMSHTTIRKLRSKLLKESAKNIKVEAELRQQLADLKELKRNRGLELQRELLIVTRAKATREAELLIQIQKTRRSSMILDQKLKQEVNGVSNACSLPLSSEEEEPAGPPSLSGAMSWFGFASTSSSSPNNASSHPALRGSDSFENFQREIHLNKMEQAHILAEMEKIKMRIAEETLNGTP